jgi:hypothetical protein
VSDRGYIETQTEDGFWVRKYEPDELNLVEIVVQPPIWKMVQVVSAEVLRSRGFEAAVISHAVQSLKTYIGKEVSDG